MDLHNKLHPAGAAVAANSDNTAVVSPIVDMSGFAGLEFLIGAGTLADADATFAVLVEEGDASNLSDAAAVADDDLIGTEALAAFQFDDDGEARKVGYNGSKRYVRCTVTPSNNTGAAPIAIIPVLAGAKKGPTDNPPS